MKYQLRFFIDDACCAIPEHVFDYTHAARMLVPRIGEHVWLYDEDDEFGATRYRVFDVEYNCYEDNELGFVDVWVTRDELDECEGGHN